MLKRRQAHCLTGSMTPNERLGNPIRLQAEVERRLLLLAVGPLPPTGKGDRFEQRARWRRKEIRGTQGSDSQRAVAGASGLFITETKRRDSWLGWNIDSVRRNARSVVRYLCLLAQSDRWDSQNSREREGDNEAPRESVLGCNRPIVLHWFNVRSKVAAVQWILRDLFLETVPTQSLRLYSDNASMGPERVVNQAVVDSAICDGVDRCRGFGGKWYPDLSRSRWSLARL